VMKTAAVRFSVVNTVHAYVTALVPFESCLG
jgi:hypothetical protein